MVWWGWLILGLALLVGEALTPGAFFLFFFGVSACLISLIAALNLGVSAEIQWVLFSAIALISIAALRQFFVQARSPGATDTDRDSPVGETAITTGTIPAGSEGHVELRGAQWTARNISTTTIPAHAHVKVVAVSGLTLEITLER